MMMWQDTSKRKTFNLLYNDYKEMNQVLADLDQAMVTLEETYIENEGEVTEETEQMEAQISGLKEILTGEGIDLLGGWLKAKEDKKKSLKAEKDYITRQMAAIDETIDFIKTKVNQILVATGRKSRGQGDIPLLQPPLSRRRSTRMSSMICSRRR